MVSSLGKMRRNLRAMARPQVHNTVEHDPQIGLKAANACAGIPQPKAERTRGHSPHTPDRPKQQAIRRAYDGLD